MIIYDNTTYFFPVNPSLLHHSQINYLFNSYIEENIIFLISRTILFLINTSLSIIHYPLQLIQTTHHGNKNYRKPSLNPNIDNISFKFISIFFFKLVRIFENHHTQNFPHTTNNYST